MSIVFYDSETTGAEAAFDQILQFAAIRTDADLKELDRFEVRSRLQAHIVPAPAALMTNRITAALLSDPTLPSHYEMVRAIQTRLRSWSPSLFAGYNSLRFDEHFLRQALYQTLHPAFLTNTNGNSRSDVLLMVQSALTYAPGALSIPSGEDGKAVLRLDRVAPANGFAHTHPHDAMSDVAATIHICRLLYERAPELWSTFMRFSQKSAAVAFIAAEPIFCVSAYYGGPHAWLVTSLGPNAQNNSEYYIFNLSVDPDELSRLSADELKERQNRAPKPIRTLRVNAAPMMMTLDEAPVFASGRDLGEAELQRRAGALQADEELRQRLIETFEAGRAKPKPEHVELQIYEGFVMDADKPVLEAFHAAPWEERLGIASQLTDRRMRQLARRLLFAERPNLFDDEMRQKLERLRAQRLLDEDGGVPWRTIPAALFEIDGVLSEAATDDMMFLAEHKNYLLACRTRAEDILDQTLVKAT